MLEGDVKSLDILPCQQSTHCFDSALHRDRYRRAGFFDRALDRDQSGLAIDHILHGFEQQNVGAALDKAGRLNFVRGGELIEIDTAGNRDSLGGGPHRSDDETRLIRSAEGVGLETGQFRRPSIDLLRLVRETVLAEHKWNRAEGRGLNKVGAGGEESVVHFADGIGASQHDVFVAALEMSAAEIVGSEVEPLVIGAERAIDNEDAMRQQLPKELYPRRISEH